MNPQIQFRHLDPGADIPRLTRLINLIDSADHLGEPATEEQQRDMLTWPGHDPVADRWVADSPGAPDELVGYCLVWKAPTDDYADLAGGVHPDWRRRGIGRELLRRAVDRAGALGARRAGVYVPEHCTAAAALLNSAGFAPVGAYAQLHAVFAALPAPVWPPGFTLCTFAQHLDWALLTGAMNRAYAGQWGHHHITEAAVRHWWERPTVRRDGIFLLFGPGEEVANDAPALAGICRASLNDDLAARYGAPTGYVDAPGLVAEYRHLPLRRPLLLAALAWLHAQGQHGAEMESWGDTPVTLNEYQALGFRLLRQTPLYGRSLLGA